MKIINAINVSKTFTNGKVKTRVLKDVNLEVKSGEFISIMGPSGSGKSTLLYILGGLDQPTSGEVLFNNQSYKNLGNLGMAKLRRRKLGFIFQFYNLVPSLTVEDNILIPVLLDHQKRKMYKQKLDAILDLIGLQDRRYMYPSELSGGQQQRVAIGRALIASPDIIFADEPIGNLDSKNGINIMNLFKKINENKKTTIIQVTHSSQSTQYGNRTIFLKDGVIVG